MLTVAALEPADLVTAVAVLTGSVNWAWSVGWLPFTTATQWACFSHRVPEAEGLEQGAEGGDFVALEAIWRWARTARSPWTSAATGWTAVLVAVREPRRVLPSRCRSGVSGESGRYAAAGRGRGRW